jgi:hypothetical protein
VYVRGKRKKNESEDILWDDIKQAHICATSMSEEKKII